MARLRRIEATDVQILYEWANDPDVRIMSVTSETILWEEHTKWFQKKIEDREHTRMYMLVEEERTIGQIRFDCKSGEWHISYSVAKEFRGKGYGRQLIQLGLDHIKNGKIVGYVKPDNKASVKIFEELGFEPETSPEAEKNNLIRFSIIKPS